jgi:hypothetical protein
MIETWAVWLLDVLVDSFVVGFHRIRLSSQLVIQVLAVVLFALHGHWILVVSSAIQYLLSFLPFLVALRLPYISRGWIICWRI